MITLNYPTRNTRWGVNELNFATWKEYWKTLAYLSKPNIHRHLNLQANIDIIYERNAASGSYSNTPRIYYYGDIRSFSEQFPSLYAIHRNPSPTSNAVFRINRKEFGETLIDDLGFEIIERTGRRDPVILPPSQEEILARISNHPDFDINAWHEGYNLEL